MKAASSQRAARKLSDADRPANETPNPLDGVIGYRLRRAQLSTFQHFLDRFSALELRPAEFSVLRVLGAQPGLRHSEVAGMLGIKRTNFVALMDGLEKRGLAGRKVSGTDRRSHALFLTDQGRKFLAAALEIFEAHESDLIRRLGGPKARDTLIDLLSRLIDDEA